MAKCIITNPDVIKSIPTMSLVTSYNGVKIYTDDKLFYCKISGWWYYFKDIDRMLKFVGLN